MRSRSGLVGKGILAVMIGLLLVGGAMSPVVAETITFGDTEKYWPGWGNGTGDDNSDTIGTPDFSGGSAVIDNGYLTSITFNFTGWVSDTWNILEPGDLFLDLGADEDWDYVVYLNTGDKRFADKTTNNIGAGDYTMYGVNIALGSSSNPGTAYQMSGYDITGYWSGYGIRNDHPVGLNSAPTSPAWGSVEFSGWPTKDYLNTHGAAGFVTFDFTNQSAHSGLSLASHHSMIIGFMPNCANDVIYETITIQNPEPASMLLMGSGLIGLAGYVRRRQRSLPVPALAPEATKTL